VGDYNTLITKPVSRTHKLAGLSLVLINAFRLVKRYDKWVALYISHIILIRYEKKKQESNKEDYAERYQYSV
jgi:hypothetical protein